MIAALSDQVGVESACKAFGIARSTYYYRAKPKAKSNSSDTRRTPDFAYSINEKREILTVMNSERYMDKNPYEIYASQLDAGNFLCSVRTMYRILNENGQAKERRNIKRKTNYKKPELLATHPNEVWSWDITKLKSPQKWTYFYLYVFIDIFSRYVVGWMVAYRELSSLATKLISETCERQNIQRDQLTIHADRGSSMKSKPVAFLMSDLGITKSHSRPYVSNDNPYSESYFKTLKYSPAFPSNFNCIVDAREFCRVFFKWYNHEHYHSGIGFMTPYSVHYGSADEILKKRGEVLVRAFKENPKRFRNRKPVLRNLPRSVWINKPDNIEEMENSL